MPDTRVDGRWRRGVSGVMPCGGQPLPWPEDDEGWWKCFAGRESGAGHAGSHRGAMAPHSRPVTRGPPGTGPWRGNMPLSRRRLSAVKSGSVAQSPLFMPTWPGSGFQVPG